MSNGEIKKMGKVGNASLSQVLDMKDVESIRPDRRGATCSPDSPRNMPGRESPLIVVECVPLSEATTELSRCSGPLPVAGASELAAEGRCDKFLAS